MFEHEVSDGSPEPMSANELLATELIIDYVRGALSAEVRDRFAHEEAHDPEFAEAVALIRKQIAGEVLKTSKQLAALICGVEKPN